MQLGGNSSEGFNPATAGSILHAQVKESRCLPRRRETPHHSYPTDPLSRGLGAIADPGPKETSSPGIPALRSFPLPSAVSQSLPAHPPDREGASLFKSSLWNKRRYRFSPSLSPPPLPSLLPPSTSALFSLHPPPLAVSTSSGLRKLCYHGDAWGWGLIGGLCCDAASRWCSPPDWLPFQCTSFSNAEPESVLHMFNDDAPRQVRFRQICGNVVLFTSIVNIFIFL